MTNKPVKRPVAAVATFKHDPFQHWLIPPAMIPGFVALTVAAYIVYRLAA